MGKFWRSLLLLFLWLVVFFLSLILLMIELVFVVCDKAKGLLKQEEARS